MDSSCSALLLSAVLKKNPLQPTRSPFFNSLSKVDTTSCAQNLWRSKYNIRTQLAELTQKHGNSNIHLSDDQSAFMREKQAASSRKRLGGMGCDDSFAFKCGKVLLDESSLCFLRGESTLGAALFAMEVGSAQWRQRWAEYIAWLESEVEGAFG